MSQFGIERLASIFSEEAIKQVFIFEIVLMCYMMNKVMADQLPPDHGSLLFTCGRHWYAFHSTTHSHDVQLTYTQYNSHVHVHTVQLTCTRTHNTTHMYTYTLYNSHVHVHTVQLTCTCTHCTTHLCSWSSSTIEQVLCQ